MDVTNPPLLPGYPTIKHYPLERYLPPLPMGIASAWLNGQVPPGGWVLDPFGATVQLPLEMARAGYRVLAAVNNPIIAFLIETQAAAAPIGEYHAALAELASARKGEERIEKHIQSLYNTECPKCHNTIQARAFTWQKDAPAPETCLIACPHCGETGEYPVSAASLEQLRTFTTTNMHHARALDRVTLPDDPVRNNVEQALQCYPARQLYALITMINRMSGLSLTPLRHKLITALILSACDEGWSYPAQRSRPKQLIVPPRYNENNLWLALEEAIADWQADGPPVPVVRWPEQPPATGGICLFPGRLRELAASLPNIPVNAIVTTLPRPNQAFWTLSALWTGWLWGREAVTPIKSVLNRQRYDWNWLASALDSALDSLQPQISPATPCLALLAEAEPSYLTAALLALDKTDFEVSGMALRPGENMAQIHFNRAAHVTTKATNEPIESIGQAAIQAHLIARAEPAPYLVLHAAASLALAQVHALKPDEDQPVNAWLPHILTRIQHIFTDRDWLIPLGNSTNFPEKSLWWLKETSPANPSLVDQVEMEVVRYLQKHPGTELPELDAAVCTLLPGLMTPSIDLLQACLESYAEKFPPDGLKYRLRMTETPQARRIDLKTMQDLILEIGQKLSYQVIPGAPLIWQDEHQQPVAVFYLAASAIIGRFVFTKSYPPQNSLVVIPGSRVNLLAYKLERDPNLSQMIAAGWRILKFRHLRHIAALPELNRENWFELINADPIDETITQMTIF